MNEHENSMVSGSLSYQILDNLSEGCWVIDRDWHYLYVNAAALIQTQRSRQQILGKTMMESYPGIEKTHMFSILRQCMEERIRLSAESEFELAFGSKTWFELRFTPIQDGVLILSLDISKQKRTDEERLRKLEALQLINESDSWENLLRSIIVRIKKWSNCEAVAIRYKDGDDFPYFVTSGFSEQFIRLENHLCSYGENGEVERDADGNPLLECMCGNILCGRFDPSKSFFTTDGSFWSNCTTDLLATTTDADRQARTRNRCNAVGYESVALIPLRSGKETFGLIQLNDRHKGRFTPEMIALFGRIANHIANFIAKKQAETKIKHLNAVLQGIRHVNQLITREKDRDKLIWKACKLLVDARGFHSVMVVLTDKSGKEILTHSVAGQKLAHIEEMIKCKNIPECACQAMLNRNIIICKPYKTPCNKCFDKTKSINNFESMVISLYHESLLYGFMVTCLPNGMSDIIEEQDLMMEAAGDIAFALHGMEIEEERNKATAALTITQEELRQAQKLEAIGQLAGGVAHDFNNILMAQIGYCDLMKEELADQENLAKDLAEIENCSMRAAALTRQLLAFSRKQTLQPEVLNLNIVVEKIEKMLRRLIGEDINFVLELDPDLASVKADPGQIEQIVINLAVNARDAMPQGGKLTIRTTNMLLEEQYVKNNLNITSGSHIMLEVIDTGCGMDENTKNRLFEPFFTTKRQGRGTGLGLSTVYGIVKQSGGNICFDSKVGRGTTFKIYLPKVEEKMTQSTIQKNSSTQGEGELVLVVEDELAIRILLSKMLSKLGYVVKVAANGNDALTLLKEEGVIPNLLITDVVMPEMSGKLLAERLSQITPALKILYISGYTDHSIVNQAFSSIDSNTSFLQKPFTKTDLAIKLRQILASK